MLHTRTRILKKIYQVQKVLYQLQSAQMCLNMFATVHNVKRERARQKKIGTHAR